MVDATSPSSRGPTPIGVRPQQPLPWRSQAIAPPPRWLTIPAAALAGAANPRLVDAARMAQMLEDAKQAHDLVKWTFGPPSAPRLPQTQGVASMSTAQPNGVGSAANVAAGTQSAAGSSGAASVNTIGASIGGSSMDPRVAVTGNPNIERQGVRGRMNAAQRQWPGHFDSTPPNKFIVDYLVRHANDFRSYAEALGLPRTVATGAALGVSEEARHVVRNGYPYPDLHESVENAGLDWWSPIFESNARYASQYSDSQADILNGNLNRQTPGVIGYRDFVLRKFHNPMTNDTGIGNINFGSAASHLIAYLNNPDYSDKDPLDLKRYLLAQKSAAGRVTESDINFDRLYRGLNDLESPTTAAIAILNGAKGYNAYGAMFGPAFLNLGSGTLADKRRQAALISTFYKSGAPGFFPDDSGDQRLPSPSQLPDVDRISHMAGGAYGLRNYADIDGALGGGPGKSGEKFAMNGIDRAMMPGIGDSAAAALRPPGSGVATIAGSRLAGGNDPRNVLRAATLAGVSADQPGQTGLPQPLGGMAYDPPPVVAPRLGRAGPLVTLPFAPFVTFGHDAGSLNSATRPESDPRVLPGNGVLGGIQFGSAAAGDAVDPAALSPWDQAVREMWARHGAGP